MYDKNKNPIIKNDFNETLIEIKTFMKDNYISGLKRDDVAQPNKISQIQI